MSISLIVAVSENGVIGHDGKLPWHLPDDLRRFKELTVGHTVVMGRRTYETIGRPLPGRRNIVLTKNREWAAQDVEAVFTWTGVMEIAEAEEETFVIGGAEVFKYAISVAERVYLTSVHANIEGDTVFPGLDKSKWQMLTDEHHGADDEHEHSFSFRTYERNS